MAQMNLSYKNTNKLTDTENRLVAAKRERGKSRRCKLLHLGWINNKVLLYSKGTTTNLLDRPR